MDTPGLRPLTFVTQAGVLTFAGLVASLHVLKPELNPVRVYMSLYAVGRLGWVMTTALLALAAGATALVVTLARARVAPRSRAGLAFLAVYALGVLAIGIFPTDGLDVVTPTRSDAIHAVGAQSLFIALTLAITAFTPRLRVTPGWGGLFRPSVAIAAVAWATLLFLPLAGGFGVQGLVQRTFTAFTLTWLFLVAGRVRSLDRAGAPVPR
jgi:hypothetical membrane protein